MSLRGVVFALDCVAATFDDDVFNLTDDHLEVQPLVPIREEFLHIPSILADYISKISLYKGQSCDSNFD